VERVAAEVKRRRLDPNVAAQIELALVGVQRDVIGVGLERRELSAGLRGPERGEA
jgi:hypothetical protein